MKRVLVFFDWLLYVALTRDERLCWDYGRSRGFHASRVVITGVLMDTWVFTTHPGVEPRREFLTRKEFFAAKGCATGSKHAKRFVRHRTTGAKRSAETRDGVITGAPKQ